MATHSFDASKYLTNLRGKEYLEVKWRLLWLRTEHQDAVVETELMKHEEGLALFRARVTLPGGASATGWGSETPDDFGDFIEKAETKALGRALAALGFGTQFCEDFNFSDGARGDSQTQRRGSGDGNSAAAPDAMAVVDAPVGRSGLKAVREGAPAAARGVDHATSSQINAILSIARRHSEEGGEGVEGRCRALYGCPPGELSKRQASEFIIQLRRPQGAATAAPGRSHSLSASR